MKKYVSVLKIKISLMASKNKNFSQNCWKPKICWRFQLEELPQRVFPVLWMMTTNPRGYNFRPLCQWHWIWNQPRINNNSLHRMAEAIFKVEMAVIVRLESQFWSDNPKSKIIERPMMKMIKKEVNSRHDEGSRSRYWSSSNKVDDHRTTYD